MAASTHPWHGLVAGAQGWHGVVVDGMCGCTNGTHVVHIQWPTLTQYRWYGAVLAHMLLDVPCAPGACMMTTGGWPINSTHRPCAAPAAVQWKCAWLSRRTAVSLVCANVVVSPHTHCASSPCIRHPSPGTHPLQRRGMHMRHQAPAWCWWQWLCGS